MKKNNCVRNFFGNNSHPKKGYEKLFSRTIDNILIKMLISELWQKKDFSNTGSILVFLPGFSEIKSLGLDLIEYFHECNLTPLYDDESSVSPQSSPRNLFYLHSQINPRKQAEAFKVGKKKIILSTNIAETSVTIPDVDFIGEIPQNIQTLSNLIS